jgi:hypothetical protein
LVDSNQSFVDSNQSLVCSNQSLGVHNQSLSGSLSKFVEFLFGRGVLPTSPPASLHKRGERAPSSRASGDSVVKNPENIKLSSTPFGEPRFWHIPRSNEVVEHHAIRQKSAGSTTRRSAPPLLWRKGEVVIVSKNWTAVSKNWTLGRKSKIVNSHEYSKVTTLVQYLS